MTVHVDEALLEQVARLSRLELAEADRPGLVRDLAAMVALAERLGDVDVEGFAPMRHPNFAYAELRADESGETLDEATLRGMAPRFGAGGFVVPRVVE